MMRRRGPITFLLILSLLAAGGMRWWVQDRHDRIIPRRTGASRLSSLNSFALGLVLGGLRGPLVMVLWTSSENQKIEKNLEDFDTKIDLIRRLQPEFASVHIFQIWNKAFNVSVMMANLQNKYATILDALDYAHSVDAERPDDVNILASIAEVYFTKLGSSPGAPNEKRYYISRVMEETLPKARPSRLQKGDPGWRRTQHDTLLDAKGMILPNLLAPRPNLEVVQRGAAEPYTGAELQLLARYSTPEMGGFPYGLSPLPLAYNYYKRAALLQQNTGVKHLYMTEAVIDSRAAVALKVWAEDEWERGRRLEAQLLGKAQPDEKMDLELLTAEAALNGRFALSGQNAQEVLDKGLFSYRRCVDAARHAEQEYRRHVENINYASNADIYFSHIDTVIAISAMVEADRDYLAMLAAANGLKPTGIPAGGVEELRKRAIAAYQKGIDAYSFIILKYYTEDDVAAAVYPRVTGGKNNKSTIDKVDPKLYPAIHAATRDFLAKNKRVDIHADDTHEYETYISRGKQRLAYLTGGR